MVFLRRALRGLRWRLGMPVASPELELGDDQSIADFYRGRTTDCCFLSEQGHYEFPRAAWILDHITGGLLLEIGCGNGGMTRHLAQRAAHLVALDVSTPSLDCVTALKLSNVETVEALVENYQPSCHYDWIVMSEVLEHLRRPEAVIARCIDWLTPGGGLLVTTPNGHWESNEHLQEFSLDTFAGILANSGAESVAVSYLRDGQGRRRWLVGEATAPECPPTIDDFNDRRSIAKRRRG